MCSLGHHDDPEAPATGARTVRMPRRGQSYIGPRREAVRPAPRGEMAKKRTAMNAQLMAEVAAERDGVEFHPEPEQFELIPRDQQQLPDHLIDRPAKPDPRIYWRDRD